MYFLFLFIAIYLLLLASAFLGILGGLIEILLDIAAIAFIIFGMGLAFVIFRELFLLPFNLLSYLRDLFYALANQPVNQVSYTNNIETTFIYIEDTATVIPAFENGIETGNSRIQATVTVNGETVITPVTIDRIERDIIQGNIIIVAYGVSVVLPVVISNINRDLQNAQIQPIFEKITSKFPIFINGIFITKVFNRKVR
ncbi:MAG: hypothetical protein WBA13_00615 [Microcoleaceae cyanobacterium]